MIFYRIKKFKAVIKDKKTLVETPKNNSEKMRMILYKRMRCLWS